VRYEVIGGHELSGDLVRRWAELQEGDSALVSPYFRPEFTQMVAAVRRDVQVGLMHDGARVVGFLPFHRSFGGVGRPVGLGLCDYHGVIADVHARWSADDLLRGCGLVRFEFDHLPVTQTPFMSGALMTFGSPVIEPGQSLDAYELRLDRGGRKQVREAVRKQRRLSERFGEVQFRSDHRDSSALSATIEWKSAQCRRTGTVDYFAIPWCRELVERIHAHQSPAFGGLLACLHVGSALIASHFMMRSSNVWHSWFPAYDPVYHEYSPGSGLLVEMIGAAGTQGVQWIDLGKGKSLYKRQFMTAEVELAEGVYQLPSLVNRWRNLRGRMESGGKSWATRAPARILRRMSRFSRYR